MNWYYVQAGQSVGPVSEEEFESLIAGQTITPETLVWNQTMSDWKPLAEVRAQTTPQPTSPPPQSELEQDGSQLRVCGECGRMLPQQEMVQFGETWICPDCKATYVQRIQEGVAGEGQLNYAGFWIRFVAKFVDGIILGIAEQLLGLLTGWVATSGGSSFQIASVILVFLIGMIVRVGYNTWFIGKYGATPGKMVCGLKVLTSRGEKVSYARACGRFFAEILSGLVCGIGYIMAAFDEQKRALHDRVCDTRVVRAKK